MDVETAVFRRFQHGDGEQQAIGRDDRDIEAFPSYLDDVVALMSSAGVRVPLPRDLMRENYILKAPPAAVSVRGRPFRIGQPAGPQLPLKDDASRCPVSTRKRIPLSDE